MMPRSLLLVSFLILAFAAPAAAWTHDVQANEPICALADDASAPLIVDDGEGGAYMAWVDQRGGSISIYAQHLDADGQPIWTVDGLEALSSSGLIGTFDICLGDAGELWVVATLYDGSYYRARVQRITSAGTRSFSTSGLEATPGSSGSSQYDVGIISDGAYGVIVSFYDRRNYVVTGYDIWAQRLYLNGTRLWGNDGVPVCEAASTQDDCMMVLSEPGSAIFVWRDYRNGDWDIYASLLDGNGSPTWSTDGISMIVITGSTQTLDAVCTDDNGGAYIACTDYSTSATTGPDILMKRIHPLNGDYWWYTYVCDQDDSQLDARIAPDGSGGVYVVWRDGRTDSYDGTSLYGQHMRPSGVKAWADDGSLMVYRDGNVAIEPGGAIADGEGNLLLSVEIANSVITQKVSDTGSKLWGTSGKVSSAWISLPSDTGACSDGDGGVITVWEDWRTGYQGDIYAQRMDRWGFAGEANPTMESIDDRPHDQGGEVIVTWNPSVYDTIADDRIDYYSLWMKYAYTAPRPPVVTPDHVRDVSERSGMDPAQTRVLLETGWAFVVQQNAERMEQYAVNAPTYGDSTDAGAPRTVYVVYAHDTATDGLWPTLEYYGWSVDNLSPGAPLSLAAQMVGGDAELGWDASGVNDEDLQEYRVYRSATPGFTPGPGTFVGAAADTAYTDAVPPPGTLYYRVTAVDIHGNEGAPSNEALVNSTTGVDDPLPLVFAVGAWPNPFNPSTTISVENPADGLVRVDVYDVRGARVRTLHDGALPAGVIPMNWDGADDAGRASPSGVYFVRARGGDESATVKVLLAR